jgi:hypothetical protein
MQSMKRPVTLVVSVLVTAAFLAGCSGAPAKNAATSTTTTAPATPTTTTTTTGAPSGAPTSTTTVPTSDQCTASELRPSWPGLANGAAGTIYYVVNLVNSSSATCLTGGYAGVSAYDPAGDLIAASENEDAGLSSSAGTPTPTLSVAPGSTIHFVIGLSDAAPGPSPCPTVGALHLIPPNETTEVQIATPVGTSYPSLCNGSFVVGPLGGGVGSS